MKVFRMTDGHPRTLYKCVPMLPSASIVKNQKIHCTGFMIISFLKHTFHTKSKSAVEDNINTVEDQ